MKRLNKFVSIVIPLVLVLIGFLILNIRLNTGIPHRDSGGFLYIADQLLEGKVLYKNLWDHKPPVIYLINAMALLIDGKTLWGVWFMEGLFLSISILISYTLTKKIFGVLPAILGSLTFLLLYSKLITGGNYAEEYTIPLGFAVLYFFNQAETRKATVSSHKPYFLIGIFLALIVLLKINSLGLLFAILIYLFAFYRSKKTNKLLYLGIGFISIISVLVLYLYTENALGNFIDQVIIYNISYAALKSSAKVTSILNGFKLFGLVNVLVLASYFIALKNFKNILKNPLVILSLIAFPIEMMLSGISGRSYWHYYLTLIPLLAILCAFAFRSIQNLPILKTKKSLRLKQILISLTFLLIAFLSGETSTLTKNLDLEFRPIDRRLNLKLFRFNNFGEKKDTLDLIRQNTSKENYILIWGSESGLYYLSDRTAASKYFYQYPIFNNQYVNESMINLLLSDIKENKPKLIIDASTSAIEEGMLPGYAVEPIDFKEREKWLSEKGYSDQPEIYKPLFDYIDTNYKYLQNTYSGKWPVYIYKD